MVYSIIILHAQSFITDVRQPLRENSASESEIVAIYNGPEQERFAGSDISVVRYYVTIMFFNLYTYAVVQHYLLPPKRDTQLTGYLRSSSTYPAVYARTNHCKNSFILHGLNKFQ